MPVEDKPDQYVWNGTGTAAGKCTIKSAWEYIRHVNPLRDDGHFLWHRWHIPRHAFVLWAMGKTTIISSLSADSREMFGRKLRRRLILLGPTLIGLRRGNGTVTNLNKKNNPWHNIASLTLAATVYCIWRERNNRVFKRQASTSHQTVEVIINTIRDRIATRPPDRALPEGLLLRWNIH
ncbi:hypothetical protein OIU85_005231 [Salix viminalis]|uniref:Reverse transcriptase zinc-binding domain-containing protein n=1 Tax=Salix viminalis TaxID=40686 RepID=A0A9Q0PUE3_SALVM|nr:hypothetical protein OIU85_005231 [Salix viminalis]